MCRKILHCKFTLILKEKVVLSLFSLCLILQLFSAQALTARTEWMTGVLVLLWGSEVHLALCLGLFCDFNVNL